MQKRAKSPMAQLRKKALMSQADVAEELGVERSTVTKWETGAAYPRAGMLMKLAKLYDCTIEELIGGAA